MAGLPPPKSPSSLVKMTRWTMLSLGVVYGYKRNNELKIIEDARRCKEECERPAKEAAAKAERDRKSIEEMAYLAEQAGVKKPGGTGKCQRKQKPYPAGGTGEKCNCPACFGKK